MVDSITSVEDKLVVMNTDPEDFLLNKKSNYVKVIFSC